MLYSFVSMEHKILHELIFFFSPWLKSLGGKEKCHVCFKKFSLDHGETFLVMNQLTLINVPSVVMQTRKTAISHANIPDLNFLCVLFVVKYVTFLFHVNRGGWVVSFCLVCRWMDLVWQYAACYKNWNCFQTPCCWIAFHCLAICYI